MVKVKTNNSNAEIKLLGANANWSHGLLVQLFRMSEQNSVVLCIGTYIDKIDSSGIRIHGVVLNVYTL